MKYELRLQALTNLRGFQSRELGKKEGLGLPHFDQPYVADRFAKCSGNTPFMAGRDMKP
jgi:hypothetical protein